MLNLREYYGHDQVRRRMLEFLGGPTTDSTTCVYVTADDDSPGLDNQPHRVEEIWECLDREKEINRSLWDRQSLIFHLDIEYVNFDYPAEPYLDPYRSLDLQRPLLRRLQEHLLYYGITPLHLLSGRGHHLVWRVTRDSSAYRQLAELGVVVDTLKGIYEHPLPPQNEAVGTESGAAFSGAGQVLEFLAHEVLRGYHLPSGIPIEVTEVETPRGDRGREIVCLDLSEYADPLNTRVIRSPFSVYHKPLKLREKFGSHIVNELPTLFAIPLFEMDEHEGLMTMRDPFQTLELARYASATIPDQTEGMGHLIDAYYQSATAGYHRWYYSQEHQPPSHWQTTYDRIPLDVLPPCARRILREPNEALLKPVGIRHIVRVLLALGWHPRHIAGLIRSKYERNHGWGNEFFRYDAASRADFYTRLFTGLVAMGIDDLNDFCCDDVGSLGYCTKETCDGSLPGFHHSLTERTRHERLACRPLHGLFLPNQHL